MTAFHALVLKEQEVNPGNPTLTQSWLIMDLAQRLSKLFDKVMQKVMTKITG